MAVRELPARRRFRGAVLDVIDVPLGGGVGEDVRADALFVSSIDSQAALQRADRSARSGVAGAGSDDGGGVPRGRDGPRRTRSPAAQAMTTPSCWLRMATTSMPSATATRGAAQRRPSHGRVLNRSHWLAATLRPAMPLSARTPACRRSELRP
ncbi:hypothetical protein [Xanthomonas sp. XNM01]|uniref:hypothetical protein n=1 Tax=Xanthomonas sp. XNM01 TaxID=2769289 RepID=UPI00177BD2C2|nr:hypothetical protein [Xanthomonas sp. XNM01]